MADSIRDWLDSIGLGGYHDTFVQNAVDLELVPHLTDGDINDLGIEKFGDRKKLRLAIDRFGQDVAANIRDTVASETTKDSTDLSLSAMNCRG